DVNLARLAVEFEEDSAMAVGMRLADRQELDDQRLSLFDINGGFRPRFESVQKGRRGEDAGVRKNLPVLGEIFQNARIEQIRYDVAAAGGVAQFLFELLCGSLEVCRRQAGSWPATDGFEVLEDPLADARRKAPWRLSHPPGNQVDDGFGKCQLAVRIE